MNKHPTRLKRWQLYGPMLVAAAVLSILTACGSANEPTTLPVAEAIPSSPPALPTPVATADPTNTVVIILPATFGPSPTAVVWPPTATLVPITIEPEPNATDNAATQVAFETTVVHNQETRLALITRTPHDPYPTRPPPRPTATWAVGWISCGPPANTFNPQYFSCWHGSVGGRLLGLYAGREQRGGDPQQGVLLVTLVDPDQVSNYTEDIYQTPQKVGAVHLSELNGTQVTLLPDDAQSHIIFTFDLATRQWVTPGPSPVPSLPPSPAP